MPTYTFRDKKTGEESEVFMKISELDEFKKNNPHLESLITGTPSFVTHTGNIINKTSGDWKDLMKRVKKGSGRGNTIKT